VRIRIWHHIVFFGRQPHRHRQHSKILWKTDICAYRSHTKKAKELPPGKKANAQKPAPKAKLHNRSYGSLTGSITLLCKIAAHLPLTWNCRTTNKHLLGCDIQSPFRLSF
jgi:hypothetical protein